MTLEQIQGISDVNPENLNNLLSLDVIMHVLQNYVAWRNMVEPGVADRERAEILYTILLSVSKLDKFANSRKKKSENEIKELIGADAALNPEAERNLAIYSHVHQRIIGP